MNITTVVNFRDVKSHWNQQSQTWDDSKYVYIGRFNARYRLPQSQWANPFVLSREMTRTRAISEYRHLVQSRIANGLDIEALRGKTLVCWCKPQACHGDALINLLKITESAS